MRKALTGEANIEGAGNLPGYSPLPTPFASNLAAARTAAFERLFA